MTPTATHTTTMIVTRESSADGATGFFPVILPSVWPSVSVGSVTSSTRKWNIQNHDTFITFIYLRKEALDVVNITYILLFTAKQICIIGKN